MPLGEVIVLRNSFATVYILAFAALFGGLAWPRSKQTRVLSWRVFGEIFSTIFFLSGLIALPIADATAIGQFTPLAITAAAALFLGERATWRTWLATLVGLMGVFMIVRPGTSAFSPAALLILTAVGLVVLRDLLTRQVGNEVSTLTLTLMSAASVILAGLMMMPFETWIAPTPRDIALLMAGSGCLTLGYAFSIIAMRNGEVAVVSPFRYSVIVFALIIGWIVWREFPDRIQMLGIALLTAAGIYTFRRERAMSRVRVLAD